MNKINITNENPVKHMGEITVIDMAKINELKGVEEYPDDLRVSDNLNELVAICYGNAKTAGWHKEISKEYEGYLKSTQLMLMVSELGECLEGVRKGKMDDHITNRTAEEMELADLIIRACDYAGRWNLDLGGAVIAKLEYNKSRTDHKPENRAKEGGKKF